ncbi:hypothetical protein CMK11_17880, partial [Candidatus Poribacteria bacterium]|nr:hypothetical protein [Candidatus Poribacteria bacterium]
LAEKWAAENRTHNLPAALTSFVGREGQIDEVKGRLRETRLLTLTGTGGTGKTRLSLRVGEEVLAEYPDGVWFVELAAISNPDLIVDAVAAVLDLRDSAEQTLMTTLTRYLDRQQTLIILDNCEHLIEGAAAFAQGFLTACSGPRILATSREVLGVNGEATWRVPSLSLPDQDGEPDGDDLTHFEAVRLFVDRAREARSDFGLTDESAPVVGAICRRLDGIPLAIELAAARVRAMSVDQIHDRLDERFRLLTGGGRTSPRRQQTLRALVDWSYRLLDEPQQALFARLSVFAGGFTMEAAEDVCAFGGVEAWDVLDLLLQLVDRSLVIVEEGLNGPRYRMLETLREYGLERTHEVRDTDEVRNRHAAHFGKFVSEQEADFQGLRQLEAFDMVEEEADNIRQALSWSMDVDVAIALRLVADLGWYWNERCHWLEAREWQARCWERSQGTRSRAMAWMLARKSLIRAQYAEGDDAEREAKDALRMATELGDDECVAWCHISLGCVHSWGHRNSPVERRYQTAVHHHRSALDVFRQANDRSGVATALLFLVAPYSRMGDTTQARQFANEATRITREVGPPMIASAAAYLLGGLARRTGAAVDAEESLRKAVDAARKVGNPVHESFALWHFAHLYEDLGDYVSAHASWVSCLRIDRRLGTLTGRHAARAAACCRVLGRLDACRTHWQEALMLFVDEDALGEMQALLALADLHLLHDSLDPAQDHIARATELSNSLADEHGVLACVDAYARLRYARGEHERAAQLFGVGSARREPGREKDPLDVYHMLSRSADSVAADARDRLGAERFDRLFAEGSLMTLEQALAEVREYLGLAEARA